MPPSKKSANPFYALLIIVGIAFVITAMSFWIMSLQTLQSVQAPDADQPPHPLVAWVAAHGVTALLVELALLAVCTAAAIGTDDYWQRRAEARPKGD